MIARNNPALLRPLVEQLRTCFDANVSFLDISVRTRGGCRPTARGRKRDATGRPHRGFPLAPHPIFTILPRFFALTDSELRLNENLPHNFNVCLAVPKAGFSAGHN